MAQSKQQKQQKALTRLLSELAEVTMGENL